MILTLKRISLLFAGLLLSGAAAAQSCACDSGASRVTGPALATLLEGKTVCVGTPGNWQNQELHSGGTVIDYKKGPGDAKDPSKAIGTYSVSPAGGGTVTYNYTSGGSFTFSVCSESTTPARYAFCQGASKVVSAARIGATSSGCAGVF